MTEPGARNGGLAAADDARAGEAAAVWAHVRSLASALEHHLPGAP